MSDTPKNADTTRLGRFKENLGNLKDKIIDKEHEVVVKIMSNGIHVKDKIVDMKDKIIKKASEEIIPIG